MSDELIINHEEAKELAACNAENSNLARCYLDLVSRLEAADNRIKALETTHEHHAQRTRDAESRLGEVREQCERYGLNQSADFYHTLLDHISRIAWEGDEEKREQFWPLTFAEMNLESSDDSMRLTINDIATGGYAYPAGDRRRYTAAGFGKAKRMGIAPVVERQEIK